MVVGLTLSLIVNPVVGIRVMRVSRWCLRKNILTTGLICLAVGLLGVMLIAQKLSAESALQTIQQREEIQNQLIGFNVKQIKSYAHKIGYKEIKRTGVNGKKAIYYTSSVRGDGVIFDKKHTGEKIISQPIEQIEIIGAKSPNALTKAKSAQIFTDSKGVAHRETYYDLPMNVVIGACGSASYSVREDGAKIDQEGYVLVAANYSNYPRCSVVETSLGPGKVYDTGGFAKRHPHGFDLATDWTDNNGR